MDDGVTREYILFETMGNIDMLLEETGVGISWLVTPNRTGTFQDILPEYAANGAKVS